MNGSETVLNVYLGKRVIANLSLHQDQFIWKYTSEWITEGFPVSPHLPLASDIPSVNINRFLRNLLPEGQAFDELIQNIRVSRNNTFALIRALGFDISGALVMTVPEKSLPRKGSLRLLTDDELVLRLNTREVNGLIIWDGKPRLSVAGIQDKINVVVNSNGQLGFGEGNLCSTHILKFERQTQSHLVINEYVTMCLAKACGLKTANVALQKFGNYRALLVERFDRKLINETEVRRRHIIDGCQALNLLPEYKYERNFGSGRDVKHIRDGASLPLIFDFANQCQNPALIKQKILDWVLFNVLVCNFDAHAKNISFYVSSKGIDLAPFYDLVNVKLYHDIEHDFAMALGDEFNSDFVNAYQLANFAESCQLSRSYVAKRLKHLIDKMTIALPQELAQIKKVINNKNFFAEYQKVIVQRCKHLAKQCHNISKSQL